MLDDDKIVEIERLKLPYGKTKNKIHLFSHLLKKDFDLLKKLHKVTEEVALAH